MSKYEQFVANYDQGAFDQIRCMVFPYGGIGDTRSEDVESLRRDVNAEFRFELIKFLYGEPYSMYSDRNRLTLAPAWAWV